MWILGKPDLLVNLNKVDVISVSFGLDGGYAIYADIGEHTFPITFWKSKEEANKDFEKITEALKAGQSFLII